MTPTTVRKLAQKIKERKKSPGEVTRAHFKNDGVLVYIVIIKKFVHWAWTGPGGEIYGVELSPPPFNECTICCRWTTVREERWGLQRPRCHKYSWGKEGTGLREAGERRRREKVSWFYLGSCFIHGPLSTRVFYIKYIKWLVLNLCMCCVKWQSHFEWCLKIQGILL